MTGHSRPPDRAGDPGGSAPGGSEAPPGFFRALAEQADVGFFSLRIGPDLAVTYLSETVLAHLGLSGAQVRADPSVLGTTLLPEFRDELTALLRQPSGRVASADLGWTRADGGTVFARITGARRECDDGTVVFEGTAQETTQLVRAQAALRESEEHYRLLAENATDIVFRGDPGEGLDWISPSVVDVLGWEPAEVLGTTPDFLVHPDDLDAMMVHANDIRAARRGEFDARLRRKDGTYLWTQMSLRVVADSNGQPVIIAGARDIDAQHRAREELARSEQLFRTAMAAAAIGIAVLDLDRSFVEVNPALCQMLEHDTDWLLRHRIDDVLLASEVAADQEMRDRILAGSSVSEVAEQRFVTASGATIWVDHALGVVRDGDGAPVSFVSTFDDITDDMHEWAELEFAAKHDPLTDLVNRAELMAQIEQVLSARRDPGAQLGILYIDVDGLKPVNDTYGHATGDDVLATIAQRIRKQVRTTDVVARVGGDEIVVALPWIHDVHEAEEVAAKIQKAMSAPIHSHGHALVVTVSIGVASGTIESVPADLLRQADNALYRAKHGGRNRVVSDDED